MLGVAEGKTRLRSDVTEQQYSLAKPLFFFSFFWPCSAACGILVPRPGIEQGPSAVEAQNRKAWTGGEFPCKASFYVR